MGLVRVAFSFNFSPPGLELGIGGDNGWGRVEEREIVCDI